MHHYQDLITIFNQCFAADFNTRLLKGDEEPIYLPADNNRSYHALFFAHGFFSSALHECSHWFIAGPERRKQVDFGYWYTPDGRTAEQQKIFQSVEIKPQAIEWILSMATGHPFRVSIDNLNGEETDNSVFKKSVYEQVVYYCKNGLPKRAQIFRNALCSFYQTPQNLDSNHFIPDDLR
ncbi:MAG: elongation factor P hydroxylase [Legionella sp.]|nr:elongation factor P hydroxylase [Legionella sp.]